MAIPFDLYPTRNQTVIGDRTIAGDSDAGGLADFWDGAMEGDDFGIRGFGGKILEGFIGPLGNQQDMHLGQRPDVPEGENMSILINLIAGNLAAQNSGEDVVGVIGHVFLPA